MLLEQVDAMSPRYSREHDAFSGLVYEFCEAFFLVKEPLTASIRFYHEIRWKK